MKLQVITTELLLFAYVVIVDCVVGQLVRSISRTCLQGQSEVLVRSDTIKSGGSTSRSGGTFHAPMWSESHVDERRCVYRFVAGVGEKVHVRFDQFRLTGRMPTCTEDFLDIYIDVASSSLDIDRENARLTHLASGEPSTTTPFSAAVYSSVLDRSSLLGRYCADSLARAPAEFVSLHREIVLDYFGNNGVNTKFPAASGLGFNGTYEFIDDSAFYPGRALTPGELGLEMHDPITSSCLFRIDPTSTQNGHIDSFEDELHGFRGKLISPTYPGWHPDGLFCAYQLIGQVNQRINVDVIDLDLIGEFNSGCATDYLLFYDGPNQKPETSIINSRFCGRRKRIRIVSSFSSLLILFVTGSGLYVSQNTQTRRGFMLQYTFTEVLLPINRIYQQFHIRGTECDYMIRGQPDDSSEAAFESPNYESNRPIAPNRACSFYFIGSITNRRLQTVQIRFERVKLSNQDSFCDQGHLAVFGSRSLEHSYRLYESHTVFSQDRFRYEASPDYIWCSPSDEPLLHSTMTTNIPLVSEHSILVLQLNATNAPPIGLNASFRVRYKFVNGYGIPGVSVNEDKCQFIYAPSGRLFVNFSDDLGQRNEFAHTTGWTNSPFYPHPYPTDTKCVYVFVSDHPRQTVRLSFRTFSTHNGARRLASATEPRQVTEGMKYCDHDFVEIIQLRVVATLSVIQYLVAIASAATTEPTDLEAWRNQWRSIEHRLRTEMGDWVGKIQIRPLLIYCGNNTPGPVETGLDDTAILIRFVSDHKDADSGFSLKYEFANHTEQQDRIAQTSSSKQIETRGCSRNMTLSGFGGSIESPNYPQPYPNGSRCIWFLESQTDSSRFLIQPERVALDGSHQDCSRAIIRMYDEKRGELLTEFCDEKTGSNSLTWDTSAIQIDFLAAENRIEAAGFRIIWTELIPTQADGKCSEFQCERSDHCISREMVCNGLPNCGHWSKSGQLLQDNSDEEFYCSKSVTYNLWHIGTGVLITFVLLFTLIGLICYRERTRRRKRPADPLAELSGSRHSLMSSQYGKQTKPCSKSGRNRHGETAQASIRSHHNSHKSVNSNDCVNAGRDTVGRKRRPAERRRSHSTLTRSSMHGQLTSVHESGQPHSLRRSKHAQRAATHHQTTRSVTLNRNGSRSLMHPLIGARSTTDMDGGLLIRERMQKISIV